MRVAKFIALKSESDIPEGPGYLKLVKGGYDGIGTQRVDNREQSIEVFRNFSSVGDVIFEEEIDCDKELSLVVAAGVHNTVFYPLVETIQEEGTCRYVIYPSGVDQSIEEKARQMVGTVMDELGTQGLFAFELFLNKQGELLMNESAPRPHNSGHITMDSMDCSQFETHMRAVAGLELNEPKPVKESAMMVNLLATKDGKFEPEKVFEHDSDTVTIHLYGKLMSRVKRKMGHINLWGENQWQRAQDLVKNVDI